MIRMLFELLVSRSLDSRRPLPRWLSRWAERQPARRSFVREMHSLNHALRTSAVARRHAMSGRASQVSEAALESRESAPAPQSVRTKRWVQVALALAASLLLALLVNRNQRNAAYADQAELLGRQLAAVPEELASVLNYTARNSQTGVVRLSPARQLSLAELPTWQQINLRSVDVFSLRSAPLEIRWPPVLQSIRWQDLLRSSPTAEHRDSESSI